jgi:hypothetical protein
MDTNLENIFYIGSFVGTIIFIGSFYGTTKKKLLEIEVDMKEIKSDRIDIIDKLARIETKLDYLNKER